MIPFLKHWRQKRTWQAEAKAEKRALHQLRRARMSAAIAEMTDDERKNYYHDRALAHMYTRCRGILSPERYRQKRGSFAWAGFAVGMFSSAIAVRALGFSSDDGWQEYVAMALISIAGGVGAFVADQIAIANFVSDASLGDPLFEPAWFKDMSRWEDD